MNTPRITRANVMRHCWHCERETSQTAVTLDGEIYWTCEQCTNTERQVSRADRKRKRLAATLAAMAKQS